jgi:hypothetical protein
VAKVVSSSEIDLSWSPGSDPQSGVKKYYVVRNGTKIATLTSTSLSYQNTGLAAGAKYSYYIVTVNGSGLTAKSSSVAATTLNRAAMLLRMHSAGFALAVLPPPWTSRKEMLPSRTGPGWRHRRRL